jgi:stage II sporulation protein D
LWNLKLGWLNLKNFRHKELIKHGAILIVFGCCFLGCLKKQAVRPVIVDEEDTAVSKHVRVLLHNKIKQCVVSSTGGFSVKDSNMLTKAHFDMGSKPLKISILSGSLEIGEQIFGNGTVISADAMSLVSVNGKLYRGVIKLFTDDEGKSFRVINELHIEEYLAGVVGAEMPSYWGKEALKAQAVAARTYCLYTKKRFGVRRQWDVKSTQANQVYRGVSAETATVKEAVAETAGMVLECTHRDLSIGIFPAYYSSTCGGHTESSYNTFGEYFAPLTGVVCGNCEKVAFPNYLAWGPVEFTETEISAKVFAKYPSLAKLKKIKSIQAVKHSEYEGDAGRAITFKLVGEDGKDGYLKGEDLRLTIDPTGKKMKSTYCEIKNKNGKYVFCGKGFGHGVGMCQYGAQAMARERKSYEQILGTYYPTASIVKR